MLPQFFSGGPVAFKATFKFVELRHDFASATGAYVAPAVRLSMKWQFILEDEKGGRPVQMAETTVSPQPFVNVDQSEQSLKDLLAAVLERIGAQLNTMNHD